MRKETLEREFAYHETNGKKPYFEGWYYKIQTSEVSVGALSYTHLISLLEAVIDTKKALLRLFADKTHLKDLILLIDSCLLYTSLSKNINDRLVQSKILKFFHKVIELPDMDEGISPRGVIMGNGTGVISQLEMHNFNFDIRML